MPRPTTTTGYPVIYRQILERVIDTGKAFKYKCETKKDAEALRFSFYAFIKACKKSDADVDQKLGELSAGVMFCLENDTLALYKKDRMNLALDLAEALRLFDEEIKKDPPINFIPPPIMETEDDQEDVLAKLGYTGRKK
jgi:hypothetical protein